MLMFHILLVLGLVALAAALWLVLRPWRVAAAVPAFAGLVLLHFSYYIEVPLRAFVFWGIATAMVAGLTYLSPSGEPDGNRASNLYVGLSAMAGCLLGMLVEARLMMLGVVIGAIVGTLAYSNTPAGRWLKKQPFTTMMQYFGAKGLPVIVAVGIVGIAIEGFIL